MKELQADHTYLIKRNHSDSLNSITVLLITDKAYHIRWNNGMDSAQTWEQKDYMYDTFRLIEDISDFVVEKKQDYKDFLKETPRLEVSTKLVQCHVCKGMGTIPAPNTTAGTTICPCCFGGKMIPEITEITQNY